MANKTTPVADIWAFPLTAVRRWKTNAFSLSDRLSVLNRAAPGTEAGTAGIIGFDGQFSQPTSAAQGGDIDEISDLEWVELKDDLDGTGISGFVARPRYAAMNSFIDDRVNPPSDRMCLEWVSQNGLADDAWTTYLPDADPPATGIRWYRAEHGFVTRAATRKPLPKGQDFRVELWLDGAAKPDAGTDTRASLRLRMGGGTDAYSLYWLQGEQTDFSRGYVDRATADTAYKSLRQPTFLDSFWDGQRLVFDVRHIAGRLWLKSPDGSQMCFTRRQRGASAKASEQAEEGSVKASVIGSGPLALEATGCSFGARFYEIAYADDVWTDATEDLPPIARPAETLGSFSRKFYYPRNRFADERTRIVCHGCAPHGAATTTGRPHVTPAEVATATAEVLETKIGRYTCEVNVKADEATAEAVADREGLWQWGGSYAMRGHSTAFVHSISLHETPDKMAYTSAEPVNIRPAVERMTESLPDPAMGPGAEWSATIDRDVLMDIASPDGGGSLGHGWNKYLGSFHPVVVDVAWMYDDGVQRAYQTDSGVPSVGNKVRRLNGFQVSLSPSSEEGTKHLLEATWRDPSYRLQLPAGLIDQRFAPLDFLLAQKTLQGSTPDLWGWEAVQYILRLTMGNAAADALLHPEPVGSSQPSLLSHKLFTEPPSGGGFLWAPPFGQSAWNWIQSLCETDFCVFFWQYNNDLSYTPVYGDYFGCVHNAPTTVLPDAVVVAGDEAKLVNSLNITGLPEHNYNRVVVWGQAPGQGDLGGMMPALPAFSAEQRIEQSIIPEQSIALTWERTLLKRGTNFWLPKVAQRVAYNTASLLRGMDVRRVTATGRGIEWFCWGHKVQFRLTAPASDPELNLASKTFRVMKVHNDYQLGKGRWTTTLNLAEQPA